jgi:signal transduction histidine kinase
MIGVNYDVTERKQVEARLVNASAEAEEANRAKDRFLAILSHELRGPLTPVLATLAFWQQVRWRIAADFREDIDVIMRNVHFQTRLIDDLLDFNRIATGKLSVRTEPMDLHELLRRCLEAHRGTLESKGLTAAVQPCVRPVANIAGRPGTGSSRSSGTCSANAIKFTASGTIDIETQDLPGAGDGR